MATAAIGLQYAIKAMKNIPLDSTTESETKTEASSSPSSSSSSFFGDTSTWFAKNFYDGGFEDKMTKREAALILGVRFGIVVVVVIIIIN